MPASYVVPAQAEDRQVRLTYLGHSTFLIESPADVTIATDYSDVYRRASVPTIVTMNRAHITHFSFYPDPGIEHVLPGWGEDGIPARHELTVEDVWIRNVTTNIRGGFGMSGSIQRDMNSMFVFEVAGLCIAHLGHLHHPLTDDHLKALGRIDVVLAPVDGTFTLNVDDMINVLQDIQAPLVIPMHYFGQASLAAFLGRLEEHYVVELSDGPSVYLSRAALPRRPTVLVLPDF
jgi:L-ascorbate metabolism protein UlaG (beta-lactamase superfamily)